MTQTLLSPLRLGALDLAHRVVMAPLTRMRAAQPGNVPHALNVEYYRQRASKGGLHRLSTARSEERLENLARRIR